MSTHPPGLCDTRSGKAGSKAPPMQSTVARAGPKSSPKRTNIAKSASHAVASSIHASSTRSATPTNSTHTPNASMPRAVSRGIASESNTTLWPINPTIGPCDWIAPGSTLCYHPELAFQVCGIDDCDIRVHRECQTYWQSRAFGSEISEIRCRLHHPKCNYTPPSQRDTSHSSLPTSSTLLRPPADEQLVQLVDAAAKVPPPDVHVSHWIDVWAELKKNGWKWKKGTGLMTDYYYIKPGRSVKGGEAGVDYFVCRDDVHRYYDSAEYSQALTGDSLTGQQIELKSLKVSAESTSVSAVVHPEATPKESASGSCDYTEPNSKRCSNAQLPFKFCGFTNCVKPVHHLCQIMWEEQHGFEETTTLRCCSHHERVSSSSHTVVPTSNTAATKVKRNRSKRKGIDPPPPMELRKEPPELQHTSPIVNQFDVPMPTLSPLDVPMPILPPLDVPMSPLAPFTVPMLPPFDDNMMDTSYISIAELQEACVDGGALSDLNDHGDGEDSDEEGVESLLHSCAVNVKMYLTTGEMVGDDLDMIDEDGEISSDVNTWSETSTTLKGAPDGWNPPGPTDKWTSYSVDDKKYDAPEEDDIDNPGNWSLFSFRPKYDTKDKRHPKYIDHFSPAGAKIVKRNEYGKRVVDGWDVFYDGWTGDGFDQSTYVRGDAVQGNLKPTSRMGLLDRDVLIKHGCNADRVAGDPFFLFQLLFPIIIPKSSTISDDHRMPFFSQMTWFTHIYAAEKGAGMGFGHKWVMRTLRR